MTLRKWLALTTLPVAFGATLPAFAQEAAPAVAAATPADSAKTAEQIEALQDKLKSLGATVHSGEEAFAEMKTTVDKLAKIKVSGYIQAQWQYADSMGINSIAGGNFAKTTAPNPAGNFPAIGSSQERFQLRRGRVKTTYDAGLSQYVLQIDVIPSGVTIKDAYGSFTDPWLKAFTATAGVFDRPFGFEISYSSSSREMPERTRVFQTLFPGERDLGAKLEFKGTEHMGLLQYINLKGGLFTGMGPTANENDNEKDFIGRAGFNAPFYDLNLAIDGGFSAYIGKVTDIAGKGFEVKESGTGDTLRWTGVSSPARLDTYDRNIMGVDAQLYYDIPVIGGISLRGEYVWGDQPGTRDATPFYNGTDTNGVYNRKVAGWYVAAVQNVFSSTQAVVRYDVFDPNTEVEGDDIGRGARANLTSADIAYATLGLGGVYHWNEWIKFHLYYDMVSNEEINAAATGGLAPFKNDLNDNVWTLRMQVKF
jgi:hypothetical protein